MKSRFVFCALLLALFVVPAFADSISISFTNQGILSGNLNSGVASTASDLAFGGTIIQPGPFATLTFDLGTFIGSLKTGGSFTGANFQLDNATGLIFQSAFSGTWEKVGSGLYDLAGAFSTTFEGVHYSGVTDQIFRVSFDDDEVCLRGLHGNTQLTASVVPEPGTLTLLGTGLIGMAGAVRRKLRLG